ncbi:8-amino-7-oxononanoate synthase (EC 2.3.1.47) [Mycetohabitans rhizoxinica HKI 454]|uniref:8-amino-7-oxononanoate synthase n=1 Tax=Mycetohabitans rhizoxinica (strain DSM 19002 / CIP 109453 / HKI 454) TaxID=882378 RepID=E5AR67_MYCRK|nr:8-amino-7-oxononanoate synthase (EC 2.3.1.47) [Mycetohabitans rhizoxinica HKI 454]
MDRQITAMTSRKTRMKLIELLGRDLSALDAEHLRRHRRIADSACSTRMSVDGRRIVGFASNDYLGLAAHPALIQALGDGARRYGAHGRRPGAAGDCTGRRGDDILIDTGADGQSTLPYREGHTQIDAARVFRGDAHASMRAVQVTPLGWGALHEQFGLDDRMLANVAEVPEPHPLA